MSATTDSGATDLSIQKSSEIRPLTSLRMIAALLVFLEHFIRKPYWTLGANFWEAIAIEGHIGVTIFFVLSGFLLTLRYYDRSRDGNLNLFDYFTKRAARIYPLYYFLLLVTILVEHIPLLSLTAAANLTLTQGFFQNLIVLIPTSWSLTTEECFYLLLPLFIFTVGRLRLARNATPTRELFVLFIVLCGWTAALALIGFALLNGSQSLGLIYYGGFMSNLPLAVYMTIFFRFAQFGVGIFFARFYQRVLLPWWQSDNRRVVSWIVYAALLISSVSIAVFTYLMNRAGGVYSQGGIYNYLVALFAGILILALTYSDTIVARLLSHPVPVYLGRISYALYLIQLIPLVRSFLAAFNIINWFVAYIALNGVSAVLYELAERPGPKIGRALMRLIKGQPRTTKGV